MVEASAAANGEDVLELVRDAVEQLRLARLPRAACMVRLPRDPPGEAVERNIDPSESLVAALAQHEAGRRNEAVASFLHGALNSPRAAKMLLGRRTTRPEHHLEVRDHNTGVHLLRALRPFLRQRSRSSLRQFRNLLEDPRVASLMEETEVVARRWSSAGPKADRADFLRMTELRTLEFAEAEARSLETIVVFGWAAT